MDDEKSSKVAELNKFGDVGQVSAILVAACYISGFVIVNAHLGKYGVRDYAAFTTDYLVAGSLFAVILGIFGFLIGKRVSEVDEFFEIRKKKYSDLGALGFGWELICVIDVMASLAMLLEIAAILVSMLLFSYYNQKLYLLLGIAVCLIAFLNFVSTSVAETKRNKWSYLLQVVSEVLIVVVFALLMDGMLESVFFFFLLMVVVASIYSDNSSSIPNKHRTSLAIYTGIFVLVILSGSFSYHFYDKIRNSIGGGKPQHIQLLVDSKEVPMLLLERLNIKNDISSELLLVAQSDREIFLLPVNSSNENIQSIRIDRDLVKAIFTQPDQKAK